mgnify:FL=1
MTDQELISEIRRGLITIMRALMRRFGLAWADFLPRDDRYAVTTPYHIETSTLPFPTAPETIKIVNYVPPSTTDT